MQYYPHSNEAAEEMDADRVAERDGQPLLLLLHREREAKLCASSWQFCHGHGGLDQARQLHSAERPSAARLAGCQSRPLLVRCPGRRWECEGGERFRRQCRSCCCSEARASQHLVRWDVHLVARFVVDSVFLTSCVVAESSYGVCRARECGIVFKFGFWILSMRGCYHRGSFAGLDLPSGPVNAVNLRMLPCVEIHRVLTERKMKSLEWQKAYEMLQAGEAVLIDVREAQDFEKVTTYASEIISQRNSQSALLV